MSLSIILGSSGAGKSTYIYKKILEEAKANKNKNFIVIVPEQYTMSTQQLLVDMQENNCIMNVDVLSFNRLAYRIFEELGIEIAHILDDVGKSLVLRKLVSEHLGELKALKKNITRITYIAQVKSLISEMTQYNITPDVLKEMINYGPMSESFRRKASDLLVLYESFLDFTNGKYITTEAILSELNKVIADSNIVTGSTIVLDGFTGFTPIQYQLVGSMLELCDSVAVTVTGDINENYLRKFDDEELFSMSFEFVQRLVSLAKYKKIEIDEPVLIDSEFSRLRENEPLAFLEKNIFRNNNRVYAGSSSAKNVIKLISLKHTRDELKFIAMEINRLVTEEGLKFKEIAVVCPNLEQYRYLLGDIWAGYEIPFFIDANTEIIFNPLIELISALFEMYDSNFSKEAVFRFLKSGFAGLSSRQIDILENYVISTGIRGKNKYFHPFAIRSNTFNKDEDLLLVNQIRESFVKPLVEFDKAISEQNTVRSIAEALYELIVSFECEKKLKERESYHNEHENLVMAKEYSQIYKLVMDLLDKMVAVLGDEEMKLDEFSDIFEAGLSAASVGVIPMQSDSVIVGDMERTRIDGIKVLFCIGASDDAIPKKVENGGILSQLEREQLLEKFEMAPSDRQRAFRQRFYLYMMLTKPSEKLYVTAPRVDSAGKACNVSYLMELLSKTFSEVPIEIIEEFAPELRIHSHAEALDLMTALLKKMARDGFEAFDDEEKSLFKQILVWASKEEKENLEKIVDALFYVHQNDSISEKVMLAVNEAFNEDEVVSGSVSKFETYSECSYKYFLTYIMNLQEREKAELSSIDMGNFYHEALEKFGQLIKNDNKKWASISEEEKKVYIDTAVVQTYESISKVSTLEDTTQVYIVDTMKQTLKFTVDVIVEQVKRGNFEPEMFELKVNSTINNIENEPVANLKGKVDRIDIAGESDRAVRIIDYKSSSHILNLSDCFFGTSIQLPIYMDLVLEKLRAEYKNVEFHPSALLYYKTGNPFVEAEAGDSLFEKRLALSRMEGLVCNDPDDLMANDNCLGQGESVSSAVVPVKLKKEGIPDSYSHTVDKDAMEIILEYSKLKAGEIAENILEGKFEIAPSKSDKKSACDYCNFKSICHFDSSVEGFEIIEQKQMKNAEAVNKMRAALGYIGEEE